MSRQFFPALLIALCCAAQAQDKPIRTVQLDGSVVFAGVDRPGDLYVVMDDGLIRKFDKDGKEIATKKYASPPTLFDPRDGTRSFAYFRESQKMDYLSPDMTFSIEGKLLPEFAISAWLVCPSKNELWILDSADLSLKQTTERGTTISYDVQWSVDKPAQPSTIVYMREYLNFLFVLDGESGIHMFNHLGRSIRHIKEPGLHWFNFLGEELYYAKGQSIHFLDLYTGEEREIPLPRECNFALLTDERMILVERGLIEFLSFKP
jgi:hypothetical protein